MLRIVLAALHLLALGIGMGSIYGRGRALRKLGSSPEALRRVFTTDTWWGIAAVLWIVTGVWRALGSTEKVSSYYWHNHLFLAKMGLLAAILLLEIWPVVTFVRWRRSAFVSESQDSLAPTGRKLAIVSDVQLLLLLGMVVAAVMLARGYGMGG